MMSVSSSALYLSDGRHLSAPLRSLTINLNSNEGNFIYPGGAIEEAIKPPQINRIAL